MAAQDAVKEVAKGLTVLMAGVGVASLVVTVSAWNYMQGRLDKTSNGYRYGVARRLSFLSNVIHRTSRDIDSAAVETYSTAVMEDRKSYSDLEDAHDQLLEKAKKEGTWSHPLNPIDADGDGKPDYYERDLGNGTSFISSEPGARSPHET